MVRANRIHEAEGSPREIGIGALSAWSGGRRAWSTSACERNTEPHVGGDCPLVPTVMELRGVSGPNVSDCGRPKAWSIGEAALGVDIRKRGEAL